MTFFRKEREAVLLPLKGGLVVSYGKDRTRKGDIRGGSLHEQQHERKRGQGTDGEKWQPPDRREC